MKKTNTTTTTVMNIHQEVLFICSNIFVDVIFAVVFFFRCKQKPLILSDKYTDTIVQYKTKNHIIFAIQNLSAGAPPLPFLVVFIV